MKKRALILEDMEVRVDLIRKQVFFLKATWAKTVQEFKSIYEADPTFDVIILDHDLGGPWYGSTDENDQNGQHAVDFLIARNGKLPPILVWSINTVAAPNMVKSLQAHGHNAVWIPYMHVMKSPVMTFAQLLP